MRSTAYGERDYTFGQAMLTLRTAIGQTQAGLADYLGVSRRAVGEWESGGSYPKAEHLKRFIALAVKGKAFPVGREAEEIRMLWKAARQKVLLDESWLAGLLGQEVASPFPHLRLVPTQMTSVEAGQEFTGAGLLEERGEGQGRAAAPTRGQEQGQAGERGALKQGQAAISTIQDWGDALAVPVFYGRKRELAELTQWVMEERCHMVCVLGMGGIGKSALSVSMMYQLAGHFDAVIFRSLRDAPSCEELVDDCLQVLAPQAVGQVQGGVGQAQGTVPTGWVSGQVQRVVGQVQGVVPMGLGSGQGPGRSGQVQGTVSTGLAERRISLLLSLLRARRVLVVLDNLEGLLAAEDVRGQFRPGFEGYGQLLHRVAESEHQSCLLFTSREKPAELRSVEGKSAPVRSLRLGGLDVAACKQLLAEKDLLGNEVDQECLIERYGGNPLALKIVAETITDLFAGEIGTFFAEDVGIFGSVTDLLGEQFARLSALERSVLFWLAIAREPMSIDELLALLAYRTASPVGQGGRGAQARASRLQVLEAIDAGYRRSLIERGKIAGSFMLQSVVLEYATAVLVAEGSQEIQQHQLDRLIKYSLLQGYAKEYVRQTQERLLLAPLLASLQNAYMGCIGGTTLSSSVSVERDLLGLLAELRSQPHAVQGYGPANLVALLRLLRGNLNGLDLSLLCMRGVHLQGVEMQGASLAFAQMYDTVFTEAASATWGVAINHDGTLWAAGGMQGEIRVWGSGGRALCLMWRAHTGMVQALAFSPNGRMLASGGQDGSIRLWDMGAYGQGAVASEQGWDNPQGMDRLVDGEKLQGKDKPLPLREVWRGWHDCSQMLAFSPDGSLLTSAGLGGSVRLWDAQSGDVLQNLEHPAHVFAIAWSPDGGLLVSACVDGRLRWWERSDLSPPHQTEILRLATGWDTGPLRNVAFAPDGRTLASVGWIDRKVKLWEVGSGQLLYTFAGETTSKVSNVVWSPDGRTLACCSYRKTIRLWDVEQRCQRASLAGHTCDINGMTFAPDSSLLLSAGGDGALRIWDVQSGQCVRVVQGYAVSHYCLDWSPDGRHLVSGGCGGRVTIWDVSGVKPPTELSGHSWLVWGVGWSPDGGLVASCGWDTAIRLWNPSTHACVQTFEYSATALTSIAWSPDGNLLAVGTFLKGMYVWDVREGHRRWVGGSGQSVLVSAAWSPDGGLLAGGSDQGSIYLWESGDGRCYKKLQGHRGSVMSVAWSADGKWLASGSGNRGNGEICVWNVQTCRESGSDEGATESLLEPEQTFVGHTDMVYAMVWSHGTDTSPPSESGHEVALYKDVLITGGGDGKLCWWDLKSGRCVDEQTAHQGAIRSLGVSPDGRKLASCGDDGAIQIWDVLNHGHLRTLRRKRPYELLDITGIEGLSEEQRRTLRTLGAIETNAVVL